MIGLPASLAYLIVSLEPGEVSSPSRSVPSELATFTFVLGFQSLSACSVTPKSANEGSSPRDVLKPLGAVPPVSRPSSAAISRPILSAPVWPPEMTLVTPSPAGASLPPSISYSPRIVSSCSRMGTRRFSGSATPGTVLTSSGSSSGSNASDIGRSPLCAPGRPEARDLCGRCPASSSPLLSSSSVGTTPSGLLGPTVLSRPLGSLARLPQGGI